jgi:hypothetical protein
MTILDMLGSEKIVRMIKEIWTIFDEPIALLCRADLGTHLERLLKGVREIVKVSSTLFANFEMNFSK